MVFLPVGSGLAAVLNDIFAIFQFQICRGIVDVGHCEQVPIVTLVRGVYLVVQFIATLLR